ncbi:phosphonate ABC transporter, permease protein PhnE [Sandarakinorhabdus sp. AAP62]|uniref:phosphonate ABC transporter, permease protein PhnE n=1 Tax=Sandarakinorhabdus sp. AAP62 TaxID=1248916 RepID=UPI0002E9AFE3|nr:phosphonate ABC transporter, permease protein PhnE [Sandarakinorhabdus sp. AAP62]
MTPATTDLAEARRIAPHALQRSWPERLTRTLGLGLLAAGFVAMCINVGFTPAAFGNGLAKLGEFLAVMFPPTANGGEARILAALGATFAMAVAGTALAVVAAIPLGLIGAKTVVRQPLLHFLIRRSFDVLRGIPALVWALMLIVAFGLGPFGGVIALAFSDLPRLAKLYAEALENAEPGPQEGIRAAGGGPVAAIRFGLLPQVLPVMSSQSLYVLEANFRNAAILGIVGAGGIGFELEERIRIFAFDQVAWIVIAYVICVMLLDMVSERIRSRLISG